MFNETDLNSNNGIEHDTNYVIRFLADDIIKENKQANKLTFTCPVLIGLT